MYLAAAGVGRLGVVDHDVIDISNLQRQVLYTTPDVGQLKTSVAKNVLTRMNPNMVVEEFPEKLNENNSKEIASKYDLIPMILQKVLQQFDLAGLLKLRNALERKKLDLF